MIESFRVQGYRSLEDLEIQSPTRFNLLVGPNNSGKTSILESMFLHFSPLNFQPLLTVLGSRTQGIRLNSHYLLENLRWLFHLPENKIQLTMYMTSRIAEKEHVTRLSLTQAETLQLPKQSSGKRGGDNPPFISGNYQDSEKYKQNIIIAELNLSHSEPQNTDPNTIYYKFPQEGPLELPVALFRPIATAGIIYPYVHREVQLASDLYSKAVKADFYPQVLQFLQCIDSQIQDFSILLSADGMPELYARHKRLGFAPLGNIGDGIRKIFYMACLLAQCKCGVLLIDELETSIHTGALQKFLDWLVKTSRQFDTQIFATTHSLECIDTVLESVKSKGEGEQLSVYKMAEENGKIFAHRIDQESLECRRLELGLEVR